MLFLLDTNAFTDYMMNHPRFHARLSSLKAADQVVTSPITRGEILFGIERLTPGRRRDELSRKASFRFESVPVYSMPAEAGNWYSRVKTARQKVGAPMEENDLWIAATAIALGAILVTRDGDFQQVPDLKTEDWTQ